MQLITLLAATTTGDDVELHTFDDLADALATATEAAKGQLAIAVVFGAAAPPDMPRDPLEVLAEDVVRHVPRGEVWLGPGAHAVLPSRAGPCQALGAFHVGGLERHLYRLLVPSDDDTEPQEAARQAPVYDARRDADFRDAGDQETVYGDHDRVAYDDDALTDGEPTLPDLPDLYDDLDDGPSVDEAVLVPDWPENTRTARWVAGFAILELPFQEVVAGYEFQLTADAPWWVSDHPDATATVEVSADKVLVTALHSGCAIDGRPLPAWESAELPLRGVLTAGGHTWRYAPLTGHGYRGLLLGGPRSPLRGHVAHEHPMAIGRQVAQGIDLPNRHAPGVRFCDGARASRARDAGYTMDRALTGRQQAVLSMDEQGQLTLSQRHARCPTFVVRDGRAHRVATTVELREDDRVVMGISIVELGPHDPD